MALTTEEATSIRGAFTSLLKDGLTHEEAALRVAELAFNIAAARDGTMAEVEDLHGRLATEEAERIRCRDGWAVAQRELDAIRAEVERLQRVLITAQHEVAEMDAVLRVVAPELIARLTSSCAWCGDEPPAGMEPDALAEYIREHVTTCQSHPMRALEAELARHKPTGQVAEDASIIAGCLNKLARISPRDAATAIRLDDGWSVEGHEALFRLAAKAQGYDAAVADNAALVYLARAPAGLLASVACWWCGGVGEHAKKCIAMETLASPHPGAALLEEHRKELEQSYQRGRDDERRASTAGEHMMWRGLALRLLVLGVMVRAQLERYVASASDGVDGCPGPGKCHGSLAWCNRCGDVKLLCDMGGRCDLHRERWTEYVLEHAPVAMLAREEGHEAGRRQASAEGRKKIEELMAKLQRARSDAWTEAVDAIEGGPLVSEEARKVMAPVLAHLAALLKVTGAVESTIADIAENGHGADCGRMMPQAQARELLAIIRAKRPGVELLMQSTEREQAVQPFLALARDRLARMSYEPIQPEACARFLRAFNAGEELENG